MNKQHAYLIIGSLSVVIFSLWATAYAVDTNYIPLTTLPGVFTANEPTNPVNVIKGVYGLAIGIGSVLAVVVIIIAGFKYMYQESISGKSGAKEQITNAFVGLLIILGSYILLRTINPKLVDFDLTLVGGTGKVREMIVMQNKVDNLRAQLRIAGEQSTERVKEIADLRTAASATEAEINGLNAKLAELEQQPQSAEIDAKIADMKRLVAELEQKKTSSETEINRKEIQYRNDKWNAIVNISNSYTLSNQINELNKKISQNKNTDSKTEALLTLSNAIDVIENQRKTLQNDIYSLRAMSMGSQENEKVVYTQKAVSDLEYLAFSQELLKETKNNISRSSNVNSANAAYAQIDSAARLRISALKNKNRPDLASAYERDVDNAKELFRIANRKLCSQANAQALAFCK